MDKATMALVATIVTSLAESPAPAREGIMYAALCAHCTLDTFRAVLELLEAGGLVVRGASFAVSLTEKGRTLAAQIESAMTKRMIVDA